MKKKKIIKIVLCALLTLVIGISMFAGNYLVDYALSRQGDGGNREVALEVDESASKEEQTIQNRKNYELEVKEEFLNTHKGKVATIENDGYKLCGDYYLNDDSHLWVILVHGYRRSGENMEELAPYYYNKGYNVLIPDLRACGESEGEYIGMGWTDRLDMLEWIDWVVKQDKNSKIVLHGISMGAATVMMTSGEDTPDNVKVYIEDCGYTTVWDVFSTELKLRFHLPEFPVLYASNFMCGIKAGYKFKDASAIDQISQCDKPMMFIHGTADDFIPYSMLDELYNAKKGTKHKLTAKGAGHDEARYLLGDEYWNEIFEFIDKNI